MGQTASAAIALLALAALAGCREPGPERPHLILVVVDTLRADHLGAYGYPRPTTPYIDALARSGTVYTHAFATSSWTRPSVASLFTSRLPNEHGAVTSRQDLAPELPTLAEALQTAGYATLGVSGNFIHVTRAAGFGRGFDHFVSFSVRDEEGRRSLWTDERDGRPRHRRAPRAHEVNTQVLRRLPPASEGPLFLYVQYIDPHSPFAPPERLRKAFSRDPQASLGPVASNERVIDLASGRRAPEPGEVEWLVDLYDAEIATADRGVGELVSALKERGFWHNAVLVLTADHGEEFGDHGGFFHGNTLHRESVHVPLLIVDGRAPGEARVRSEPVDGLDVAPTLLALAGVGAPEGMRGRSLVAPGALPPRDLVAELSPDPLAEQNTGKRTDRAALERGPWRGIARTKGPPLVYRWDRDADEQRPLDPASAPPELLEALSVLASRAEAGSTAPARPLDDASLEALRELGYVE